MFSLSRKTTFIILAGIMVLAFLLRFHNIGKHGLAGDEKYSLFVSQFVSYEGNNQRNSVRKPDSPYFTPREFWSEKSIHDFFDSIARIDTGNGALYTYSLHYWTQLVGLQDADLRFMSLIFNLLTVFLTYVFVNRHFKSSNLALLASFLAAVSPFNITYSQVARNYALLFFFSLLATHLFLIILEKEKNNKSSLAFYLYYGLSALACELCHISAFPLFLIHGLYVIIYVRKLRVWVGLALAMLIPAMGVVVWLKSDGGRWLIEYVENSVKSYNIMARTAPDDYLSVATLPNIFKQLRFVVSSAFITSEGLYIHLSGLKNTIIALVSVLAGVSCFRWLPSDKLKVAGICGLLVLDFFLYSTARLHFMVLTLNIALLVILLSTLLKKSKAANHPLLVFLSMLTLLPFVFLILFSIQDGNTFRIMPRYIGYMYAFGIVLTALLIRQMLLLESSVKYALVLLLGVQLVLVCGIVVNIWEDKAPRYFMHFAEPRKENPYKLAADKIVNLYAKGDTVIYCSFLDNSTPGGKDLPPFSVVDAQLTNFYLPKNSDIIQRVNPEEQNRIFIKKSDGREILITDLKKSRY
ncbi:glycosyltransferase family 39 protein [Emticicia sp. 21SJ11W-3]|uniref:glycosyltransferase family 39 protein n=1 Tax=Emticicia sp. 21SJ11W-3 TaxID=2916755 RepID=UPI00209D3AAF|nr:glycosyltransferase family 39 protein [Emticicia sp. 21SJ11W-3]UTA69619.1 glycosyltransferase family 39 protein [Emticicia sp. 21SJ11W-3]